jgi:hypothetical protein
MPASDPFSYTVPGMPWNNHEWLFELAVALIQRSGGWGGIRLLVLGLVLATATALAWQIIRRVGVSAALFVLTLFALFCRYKMMPVPQLVSMSMFLAAFALFRGSALACSWRRHVCLIATMLVWGNVTAECFMFLPFVLLDQLALRMQARASARRLLDIRLHALLLLLACVAPMVNPPWSSALEYAFAGTSVNRAFNSEFASILAPATTVTPFAKLIAIVLMTVYVAWSLVALIRSRARWSTLRALGPGLLAVVLAASFERNLWLLLLPAARMASALHAHAQSHEKNRIAFAACTLSLSVGLFVGLSIQLHWTPALALSTLSAPSYRSVHLQERALATACLTPLIAREQPANVYALRLWANYLIFRVPQHKVFVDGRNREYPERVHEAAQHILTGAPDALALLNASHTDFVLVPQGWEQTLPVRSGVFRSLAQAPGCVLYGRR